MKKETKNTVAALGVGAAVLVGTAVLFGGSGSGGDDWNADGSGGGGGGSGFDFGSLFDGIQQQEQDFWDQIPTPEQPYDTSEPPMWDDEAPFYDTATPDTPTTTTATAGGGLLDGLKKVFTHQNTLKVSAVASALAMPNPASKIASLGGAQLGQSAGARIMDTWNNRHNNNPSPVADKLGANKNNGGNGGNGGNGTATVKKSGGGGFGSARVVEAVKTVVKKDTKVGSGFGGGGIGGGFGGGGGGVR